MTLKWNLNKKIYLISRMMRNLILMLITIVLFLRTKSSLQSNSLSSQARSYCLSSLEEKRKV